MFYSKEQIAQAYDPKAELIRHYGRHTLAFFGQAQQNRHFLAPGEEGVVSYRLERNVAVVLGDPVCAPEAFERVTRSFLDYCVLRHWRVAFYQTYPEHLAAYRGLKLHAFKIGEEALIDPQSFTLRGSAIANVRISARRAERDNVAIQWHEGRLSGEVLKQLERISDVWLEHKTGQHSSEMGFSMGRLEDLSAHAEQAELLAGMVAPSKYGERIAPRVVAAVAMTRSNEPCAFVTFLPVYGAWSADAALLGSQSEVQGWGWTLDLMRRAPDAPPGVIELLLVRAIEHFRACGAQVVSFGMVAMADTLQEMTVSQRQLATFVADRLHLLEGRQTLFNFKQKFLPRWESRYIVTSSTLALPQIALAILRLRNYSGGGLTRLIK